MDQQQVRLSSPGLAVVVEVACPELSGMGARQRRQNLVIHFLPLDRSVDGAVSIFEHSWVDCRPFRVVADGGGDEESAQRLNWSHQNQLEHPPLVCLHRVFPLKHTPTCGRIV